MQQLKKPQDVLGSIGQRGEGRSNDPHKQPEVVSPFLSQNFSKLSRCIF
jgi:hypothetical protein